MENISYHGTSLTQSNQMIGKHQNTINVDLGKGELGKGFYTGTSIALAATWAYNKHKDNGVIIHFIIKEEEFIKLRGHIIKKRNKIVGLWKRLMKVQNTDSHKFGYDYVVSPFATIEETGSQIKFESKKAEEVLNNSKAQVYEITN